MTTEAEKTFTVPLAANAWITAGSTGTISKNGLANWINSDTIFSAYIYVTQPGILHLSIRGKVPSGNSQLKISAAGQSKIIKVNGSDYHKIEVGDYTITEPGYTKIDFQGINRTGGFFADVSDLIVSGIAIKEKVRFIDSNVHFGRRGPSVHLTYVVPKSINVEWFYNEVTVPTGNDTVGSYFMANGFAEGYFGIQVNTSTKRRVLFSVWHIVEGDDPSAIHDSKKVKVLQKGENVKMAEFGGEGSGNQCYLTYDWKANVTYKFLTRAQPDGNNNTIYTSWFYATEQEKWFLMASFKRPNTNTYLKGLYSFLENFEEEQGFITRKAYYGNQWAADANGVWYEITEATFTGDDTARKQRRMDYSGGVKNNQFFLVNCGFFNGCVALDTPLSRKRKEPTINFDSLPSVNETMSKK